MFQPQIVQLGFRKGQWLVGVAMAAALGVPAAQSQPLAQPPQAIDVPAGALGPALLALAAQTHQQVLFSADLVSARKARALKGRYPPDKALAQLLAGSGLRMERLSPTIVVLRPPIVPVSAPGTRASAARPFGVEAAVAVPTVAAAVRNPAADAPVPTVEAVEVTGTHIRGAGLSASPLKELDRRDLDRLGQFTLAEALATLPQNFSGQNTEQARTTTADRIGNNTTFASGVNLRGLGSDATLVLVNGRRLGGAGAKGDFTDVSTLPSIAVDRVDLLLDGASAIYGSDAVGGVVNILLRHDLDGGELRVQAGEGDDGKPDEQQVGGIVGKTWSGGGLMAAYELYRRSALSAADRSFTASADLRPLGGRDFRQTFAFPGNIVGINPATGLSGPFFAIPGGQNGLGLTHGSFLPGMVNLNNQHLGLDILPDEQRQSVYLSAHQSLADRVEVSGEVIYGFRRARATLAAPTSTLSVTPADPFFVSPIGATSEQVQFAFDELPPPVTRTAEETLSVTTAAKVGLGGDWESNSFLSFSQESEEARAHGILNSTLLAEALGNVADRPTTAFSPGRDGFFNPFTAQDTNTAATLAAIGSGFTVNRSHQRVYTLSTQADGTVLTLPGGPLKLAIGGQLRKETFLRAGTSYTSTVAPVPVAGTDVERTVGALFGELRAPVFGPENSRSGFEALEFSAALRWERYSDFGGSLNPKLGVFWTPLKDLNLRATFGRSFRAPGLRELDDPEVNSPIAFPVAATHVEALVLSGGNAGLRPETANSYTVGADWRPTVVPGLQVSITGYHIDYQNRIDTPVTANLAGALTDPTLASFVRHLDPNNASDLAAISALLASPQTTTALGVFPASAFGAIVDNRYVNTGTLKVDGIDLEAGYGFPLGGGRLELAGTASDVLRYDQQLTPTSALLSRAGLVGFPAKFHDRMTADWTRGALTLGLAVNQTSAFHDIAGIHVDALTTVDLQVRAVGGPDTRWSGLTLGLTVRNLFNADPPFYNNPLSFGFDGANADVIGRFVSVQLTKSW